MNNKMSIAYAKISASETWFAISAAQIYNFVFEKNPHASIVIDANNSSDPNE